jgi:hypothetical protein
LTIGGEACGAAMGAWGFEGKGSGDEEDIFAVCFVDEGKISTEDSSGEQKDEACFVQCFVFKKIKFLQVQVRT